MRVLDFVAEQDGNWLAGFIKFWNCIMIGGATCYFVVVDVKLTIYCQKMYTAAILYIISFPLEFSA